MHVLHDHVPPAVACGSFIPAAAQSNPFAAGAGAFPGRGASHTVHFSVALAGFCSAHVEHVHLSADSPGFCMPAAAQSKPFVAGAEALPGRGASQTVHLSVAEAGFCSEHMEHVHLSADPDGFAIPAAAQLKPVVAGAEGLPGRGASQIVHFSVALAGFCNEHIEHVHLSPASPGFFIPAAAQSKPFAADAAALPGLGASHTVHFSVALAGFWRAHVEHVHLSAASAGFCMPAADQSKPFAVGAGGGDSALGEVDDDASPRVKVYVGSSGTGAAFAASRALSVLGPAPAEEVGKSKE